MMAVTVLLAGNIWAEKASNEEAVQEAGTDPRDFAPKFMPYYKYTKLENDLEQQDFVAFGLLALKPNIALTYELFLAQERDFTDVDDAPPEFEDKKNNRSRRFECAASDQNGQCARRRLAYRRPVQYTDRDQG